jgi:hypothetical protein
MRCRGGSPNHRRVARSSQRPATPARQRAEELADCATDGKASARAGAPKRRSTSSCSAPRRRLPPASAIGCARRSATFGPNRSGGRLESSKTFSKRFMERHRIPTAKARDRRIRCNAQTALEDWRGGCVVKADGLAAGKGVVGAPVAASALAVLRDWYGGWSAGRRQRRVARGVSRRPRGQRLRIADGRVSFRSARPATTSAPATATPVPTRAAWARTRRPRAFPTISRRRARTGPRARRARPGRRRRTLRRRVLYCGLMWTQTAPTSSSSTCVSAIPKRKC